MKAYCWRSSAITRLIAGATFAQVADRSDSRLTQEEQLAFEAAHASWLRFSEMNEEVGLPPLPLGNEPKPEDFIDIVDKRKAAEAAYQAALEEKKSLYADKLNEGRRNAETALRAKSVQYRANREARREVLAASGVRKLGKQWEEYRRVANAPMDTSLRRILSPENGLLPVAARNGLLEVPERTRTARYNQLGRPWRWPPRCPMFQGPGVCWSVMVVVFSDHDEFPGWWPESVTQLMILPLATAGFTITPQGGNDCQLPDLCPPEEALSTRYCRV